MDCDLVVLATGQVPNVGPDPYAQLAVDEAEDEEEKAARARRSGGRPAVDPQPGLSPGHRPAAAQVRLRRLPLHLLPLRDPPHRHLRRRSGAPSHGHEAGDGGRRRRHHEGDPGRRERRPGPRRPPARRRPQSTRASARKAAPSASAAPWSAPSAPSTRTSSATRMFNESRCRRCGTCMGACPVRVISFENYSIDTVGQQIKAVDMPGRVLREAAHPGTRLRERRLPGARHGRPGRRGAHPLRPRHPGALPGFGEPVLGHRRAQHRLRRHRAHGLPARRRLPVPLRARLQDGRRAHEQGRRHPADS